MDSKQPGKSSTSAAPFEIVHENQMDYEHWKDNPEFRAEGGGEGELFGRDPDMSRPDTPSSMMTGPTRTGTFDSTHSRSRSQSADPYNRARADSRDSDITRVNDMGTEYPRGYHPTPSMREQSPAGTERYTRQDFRRQDSREGLVPSAARMGQSPPPRLPTPNAPSPGGYGRIGNFTPDETPGEDTSYDYFRRGLGLR